jgi:hypothetical protein
LLWLPKPPYSKDKKWQKAKPKCQWILNTKNTFRLYDLIQ